MDLDETTLATISLLEARLLRIEHLLYGHTAPPPKTPAIASLQALEHRFATLLQSPRGRVYAELLKIYNAHPSLFAAPTTNELPSTLTPDAQRAIVLAAAASYPATSSCLTSISDTPVPDPALSAGLVALLPRMKGVEATQIAQVAEVAELRARSENLIRHWYERGLMGRSAFVADVESRVLTAGRDVRRAERAREEV